MFVSAFCISIDHFKHEMMKEGSKVLIILRNFMEIIVGSSFLNKMRLVL